jgi:hypothetical protein
VQEKPVQQKPAGVANGSAQKPSTPQQGAASQRAAVTQKVPAAQKAPTVQNVPVVPKAPVAQKGVAVTKPPTPQSAPVVKVAPVPASVLPSSTPVEFPPADTTAWQSGASANNDPWHDSPFGSVPLDQMVSDHGTGRDHLAWPTLMSPPPPHSDEQWMPASDDAGSATARIAVPLVFLTLAGTAGVAIWQYQWIIEQVQLLVEKYF